MFDLIAPRYDRFTRVFSYDMDRRWKAELMRWMARQLRADANVLDLACGTGDLAFAAAERAPRGAVLGVDASVAMIDIARARAAHARAGHVRFAVGDVSALDVPTASVDAITAGYALRNVPDYRRGIAEIARVLKPGGVVATLDFYRPRSALWRRVFLSYLSAAGNLVGWLWHREPVVYGYIARSIDHFVSWQEFSASLVAHGMRVERVRTKLLGGVALHFARRGGPSRHGRDDRARPLRRGGVRVRPARGEAASVATSRRVPHARRAKCRATPPSSFVRTRSTRIP